MKNQKGSVGVVFSIIIIVAFVGLVIYVFLNKKDSTSPTEEVPIIEQEMQTTTDNKDIEPINNNSQNTMEKISKNGDVLVMNYTGRLTNGTVFDSNVDPKFSHVEPFEFTLGAGMVIKGWDEGLVGMKIGEKKTLTITPDKGYGSQTVGPIPANSTLIFDVELVDIK